METFAREAERKVGKLDPPPGVYCAFGGEYQAKRAAERELLLYSTAAGAGILLLLWTAFGSVRRLLLVLLNLPFALVGGVAVVYRRPAGTRPPFNLVLPHSRCCSRWRSRSSHVDPGCLMNWPVRSHLNAARCRLHTGSSLGRWAIRSAPCPSARRRSRSRPPRKRLTAPRGSAKEGLAWAVDLPGYGQSPPVGNGVVYVTAAEGDQREKGYVVALDAKAGKEKWRHTFEPTQKAKWACTISRAVPTPTDVRCHDTETITERGSTTLRRPPGR